MDTTPISVELELRAYKDSTDEIAGLLDTTLQLESMPTIISNCNEKLASLRTQLGAVMQTQLDDLTDSLRLVEVIKDHTISMQRRFDNVQKNCEASLKSLGTNKDIEKLYIARKNLMNVMKQLTFINDLPSRLQLLKQRLNDDYRTLKWVYDEWIGYYSWMWKVKDQMAHLPNEATRTLTATIYGECFAGVTATGELIEEKLWEHVYRCMELCVLDPASLVRALVVIEKNQRRKDKAVKMVERGNNVCAWVAQDKDWVEECQSRLLLAIQKRCEHAYNSGTSMKDKLKIGMQLLGDLETVKTKLAPCFPPHYHILDFFIHNYVIISNNNLEVYYNDATLEPGEILVLVEWLDSFLEEVQSWGSGAIPEFVEAKERLLRQFEVNCVSRMEVWFQRILERGDVPLESSEGDLRTAVPEDIFNLIKTQSELAAEHLKDKALCEAIRICTSPIATYCAFYQEQLEDESSSERDIAALINNNNNLREYIEGLPDLLGEMTEAATSELNVMLSAVTQQLVDLNTKASHAVGAIIIGDIDASRVLYELNFTEDWLYQEEADGILTMTSTFLDYFNDLQVWIQSKYFFGMIVIDCLHNAVNRYFHCFCLSKTCFNDCMELGSRIKTDYDCLLSFFTCDAIANSMKFTDRRYRSGEYIAEILQPIRNLEIFFKQPADNIILNGEITDEGYRLILSLVGNKLMENGIKVLMMSRADISVEDKVTIMEKFASF